ncbi:Nif3-like dinuclear metal center hexameric protein [Gracilibacillus sp. D59]|uniref:Nif3-like dinuclear metal center hexameric protein n=1 Tax=Gracilibacillus sp. D59 TaxID=3457434 RepID=UPI003FCD3321
MITVQDVIDQLEEGVMLDSSTVDGLMYGDSKDEIKGITVSFMPSIDVIKKNVDLKANLLITHEALFYQHHSNQALEKNNSLVEEKKSIIEQTNLAIYRNHDAIHRYQPDGITHGLIAELDWQQYVNEQESAYSILHIPNSTLAKVATQVKQKLGINYLRFVGNKDMKCEKIAVLVGYRGNGPTTIPLLEKVDLVIYGEGPEWETPEFVWDASQLGVPKGLIQLGHAESEDPGMKWLANQLKDRFPSIPVTFLPTVRRFQLI